MQLHDFFFQKFPEDYFSEIQKTVSQTAKSDEAMVMLKKFLKIN